MPRAGKSVYFLQGIEGGAIKIGCAYNVKARMRAVGCDHKRSFRLLATMDGGAVMEHALHETFDDIRVAETWEWFHPEPELLDYISREADPSEYVYRYEPRGIREARKKADKLVSVVVQVVPEWRAWAKKFADSESKCLSYLLATALDEYAKVRGFDPAPPCRGADWKPRITCEGRFVSPKE
jgi:hypothetical protein